MLTGKAKNDVLRVWWGGGGVGGRKLSEGRGPIIAGKIGNIILLL